MGARFEIERLYSLPVGRLGKNEMRQGVQWRNKAGFGKFNKRQLNRALRRFAKMLCREGERAYLHARDLKGKIRQVKCRGM